ncbi:flagellar biosynthetic protein FliR [Methylobrevis pamukkalensis]|uniref:Flagellar biosynthetic protein FliR n=1 Tax=Methylobrevis pamukkalensis TaxID=1439726 RepID=A0A1E3GZE8_9HYPH|nr:flagellar biosynthetic protein FliR [Methylobrevis pamukkalensis]ODN68691.1 flagellar biosynthesis protein FliR [Methylobrevis pamukkalensis]
MTIDVLPDITVVFLVLFARIGTLVMLMPGLGEQSVPMNVRLALALLLTLVFYPLTAPSLPAGLAENPPALMMAMIREVLVGLGLGLLMRMLMSLTQTAGAIIAQMMGLSFAQSVDPTMGGAQGAILGSFLGVVGITMIFVTDLHHLAIAGLAGSYRVFPPGSFMPIGDMSRMATSTIAGVFVVAVQISAPFIVFGLVFNFALGLLAKLMPQLQVFFLAMPVTIFVGMMLFALLLMTMVTAYLGHLESGLMRLVPR